MPIYYYPSFSPYSSHFIQSLQTQWNAISPIWPDLSSGDSGWSCPHGQCPTRPSQHRLWLYSHSMCLLLFGVLSTCPHHHNVLSTVSLLLQFASCSLFNLVGSRGVCVGNNPLHIYHFLQNFHLLCLQPPVSVLFSASASSLYMSLIYFYMIPDMGLFFFSIKFNFINPQALSKKKHCQSRLRHQTRCCSFTTSYV